MEDCYASLLSKDDSGAPESSWTVIAVLVSRRCNDSTPHSSTSTKLRSADTTYGTCRLAVTARVPRKRIDCNDPVRYTLLHFSFLDDKRRFTNLSALLTRLAPVTVVHVAATENAEAKEKCGSSRGQNCQHRQANEVCGLLGRLGALVDSRTDVRPLSSLPATSLAHVLTTLPNPIHSPASSLEYTDRVMASLLAPNHSLSYDSDPRLMDNTLSKRSLALLLHCQSLPSDPSDDGAYEIRPGHLDSYLTLDRTAAECINLLPHHPGIAACLIGGNDSNNSIYGTLNQCKTKMGARTLEVWLRQPLVQYTEILERQGAVQAFVEHGIQRDRIRDEGLGGMASIDLDRLCWKLVNTVGGPNGDGNVAIGSTSAALEGLYRLFLFADRQLPMLIDTLKAPVLIQKKDDARSRCASMNGGSSCGQAGVETENCTEGALQKALAGLIRVINELSLSVQLVEAVLDFSAAPRQFLVKASMNEELTDIREELNGIDDELSHLHKGMNNIWMDVSGQSGQVRLETDSGGSGGTVNEAGCVWQFRIPDTNALKVLEAELRDQVTVHRVLKNGVYFTTKELKQLGAKKHDLLAEYDKQQLEIVQNAMTVAVTYVPVLERASVIIAQLDVFASLAHVAAMNPHGYCRPTMTDSEDDGMGIELKGARHPCVELQDNVDYIPNNISLIYGSSNFLLVTGPNMGGKSTYIRALGAIITMAQIGSYVPCTAARINIVHHILARVGAGDVQNRGISTFMAEMLEASSILRTATKRSLIIIDELGRGTSTFDGFGLATAISEYIVQRIGCMTVFATHFHELTALEDRERCVTNCHVTAQRATDGSNRLTFLYEVRPGPCLESFGIQVAEMANVPPAVIIDAKRKAKQLERFGHCKKTKDEVTSGTNNDESNHDVQAAMKVMCQFKELPMNTFRTIEEKRNALRKLLQ